MKLKLPFKLYSENKVCRARVTNDITLISKMKLNQLKSDFTAKTNKISQVILDRFIDSS